VFGLQAEKDIWRVELPKTATPPPQNPKSSKK
jgi:hypothetical protein